MSVRSDQEYSVGIDLGTQSLKAVILDLRSKLIVESVSVSLKLTQNNQGLAEQHASDWVLALEQAFEKVSPALRSSVVSLSVSGQQHGLVVLKGSDVIAPVKLWCDTTSSNQCNELIQCLGGEEACLNAVGNLMFPGFTAPKLKYLKEMHSDVYHRMEAILLPHDYLNFWLTGELCMEMGDASGTGLLDIRKRTWSKSMINAVDDSGHLGSCLPVLRDTNVAIGSVKPDLARSLGLPKHVKVAIGGGDNMMAAIGTGVVSHGRTTMSLGTSGTIFSLSDKAIENRSGEIANFCSSNGAWLPLVCTMACTTTTETMRDLFNASLLDIGLSLDESPIGAQGLTMLAYLNGERTPNFPHASGVLAGINSQNMTQANLLRASVEGVTFGLYYGFELLQRLNIRPKKITLTGGGSNSPQWCQMIADLFQLTVVVYENNEGAAFGAAIQAGSLIDNDGVVDEQYVDPILANYNQQMYRPNNRLADTYQRAYKRYLSLQSQMQSYFTN